MFCERLESRRLLALLPGDADWSGAVTGDDYAAIDFSIGIPGAAGYANGDFNGDGQITGDDYSIIDFNIGLTLEDVTGPTSSNLTPMAGDFRLSVGETLTGVEITGSLYIEAGATFRNARIIGTGPYGIRTSNTSAPQGILIEDVEITGTNSAGIYGGGWTGRRLNVHHVGADTLKPSHWVTIENSWFHDMGLNEGAHADGIQSTFGDHLYIRDSYFDFPDPSKGGDELRPNVAIFLQSSNGPITDVIVEDSWLNGAAYTLHLTSGAQATFRDNVFGRQYKFGLKRGLDANDIWENNVWVDTGALIPK